MSAKHQTWVETRIAFRRLKAPSRACTATHFEKGVLVLNELEHVVRTWL
jgi:hypothetical protein